MDNFLKTNPSKNVLNPAVEHKCLPTALSSFYRNPVLSTLFFTHLCRGRSCMELVVWRPPEDPLTQRLKDSLQRQQRKQLAVNRQTPTPVPSISSPPSQPQVTATNEQTFSPLFSSPALLNSGEEDMEL